MRKLALRPQVQAAPSTLKHFRQPPSPAILWSFMLLTIVLFGLSFLSLFVVASADHFPQPPEYAVTELQPVPSHPITPALNKLRQSLQKINGQLTESRETLRKASSHD